MRRRLLAVGHVTCKRDSRQRPPPPSLHWPGQPHLNTPLAGILGGLALRADAALTREALEQAARYRDCLAFSVGAFNLGQGGGMWLVGYANKWWPLPERVCGMLTAAVAGSDWWDVPPTRRRD